MAPKTDESTREPMDCRSMMQRMMAKMCSEGGCNPAAMCQQMMAFTGPTTGTQAEATPEPSPSPGEATRSADGPAPRCCAPPSGHAPKQP